MEEGYDFSVNGARRDIKMVICTCPKGVNECAEVMILEFCARSLIDARAGRSSPPVAA